MTTNDKPLSTYCPAYVAGLERTVEDLTAALELVLGQVDYTASNCSQTDMVGAVLPREVIKLSRDALQRVAALQMR